MKIMLDDLKQLTVYFGVPLNFDQKVLFLFLANAYD